MSRLNVFFKVHLPDARRSNATFSDLRAVWDAANTGRLLRVIDIAGKMRTFEDFSKTLFSPKNFVTFIFEFGSRAPLAMAWFTKYAPEMCLMHFTPLGKKGGVHMDALVMSWLEETFLRNNLSRVSLIFGHVPVRYAAVIELAKRVGFVEVDESRYYGRTRQDGTERRFTAKVMMTHVPRLRKYLASVPEPRVNILPPPA